MFTFLIVQTIHQLNECLNTPFQGYASKIRIFMCVLIFYEEIGKRVYSRETFGHPKEVEWGPHTGSQRKIDRFELTGLWTKK